MVHIGVGRECAQGVTHTENGRLPRPMLLVEVTEHVSTGERTTSTMTTDLKI